MSKKNLHNPANKQKWTRTLKYIGKGGFEKVSSKFTANDMLKVTCSYDQQEATQCTSMD